MTHSGYTLFNLEEEARSGRKWFVGSFLPETHGAYSSNIEVGYLHLQHVDSADQYHLHVKTEEYYLVLSGYMKIQIDTEIIDVSPGHLLLVRPHIPHIILEVIADTRILLLKAPSNPQDKVIVAHKALFSDSSDSEKNAPDFPTQ
ncbi:cupin domain-containing protein [Candidatus Oscillochloris fontis]|uniref:cupin domain-containing protein n=1 Tax=Candidatus Oscillochloris fontis TaxID=2496868 RepID=UPI00101C16C9|nr:cupin domain-containing protein [Candidatus Oscillochloris fontis]